MNSPATAYMATGAIQQFSEDSDDSAEQTKKPVCPADGIEGFKRFLLGREASSIPKK